MLMASLLDAGVSLARLKEELARLTKIRGDRIYRIVSGKPKAKPESEDADRQAA
jgi:uncharacterized protein (DUF111 family)